MLISRLAAKMQQFYYTATILVLFGMDINDYPGTTAIWVSLEGCYISLRHNSSRSMMPKNGPRQCFDACPNSTYIGLQGSWCMCDTVGENYALPRYCASNCSGETDMICGADPGIAVYSKVNPVQNISVRGDFGCVYVDVSVPSSSIGHNFRLHATNNCSEEHFGAYIDALNSRKCVYELSLETWFKARDKFLSGAGIKFLLPEQYVRSDSCPPQTDQGININSGEFWIGLIWITTDTTTTSMNTMAMISTNLPKTSSTPATTAATTTTPILTEHQSTKISVAASSTIFSTTNGSSTPVNLIAVYIAVPVAVIVVAILVVLGFILLCKKRSLLCFKERQQSGKMDDSNNASPQEIPELLATMTLSSVPPGSTLATFQSQRQNGRPTTARERDIQDGHRDQTLLNLGMSYINMGGETQYRFGDPSVGSELAHNEMKDTMQSNMNVGKKHKEKRERKRRKKEKHSSSVHKEYEDINANTEDNHEHLYSHTNDDLSVINGRTEHSNGAGQDNETKKKTQRAEEYSYSDEEIKNASPETYYKRRVATISQFMGNLPDEPNDRVKHSQDGGLFYAPAATPVIDEQTHLRLRRKHKKSRMKDEKCGNEDRPDQADPDSNEVLKEPTDNNNVTQKEKKKKRKKSRDRSKEKVQNGYDEVGDVATAMSVPEEQNDLQNEESSKKYKKKRRKKHKKRDEMNAAKQEGLDLENDEND